MVSYWKWSRQVSGDTLIYCLVASIFYLLLCVLAIDCAQSKYSILQCFSIIVFFYNFQYLSFFTFSAGFFMQNILFFWNWICKILKSSQEDWLSGGALTKHIHLKPHRTMAAPKGVFGREVCSFVLAFRFCWTRKMVKNRKLN